jgi:sugar lactone lactonase YvrE
MIFDHTPCFLGEGPLWHPLRQSLFWFDIINMKLFERKLEDDEAKIWSFDEHVSAAGWMDKQNLLVASETRLFQFDLETDDCTDLVALEADNPVTRSNDGRADPCGGFWIGTMGKKGEEKAGAIYRYFRGELRMLYDNVTTSNSICFAPDGRAAYFCDTPTKVIMKVDLDDKGWPQCAPEVFAEVAPYNPDGSVVDSEGYLWNAQWGAHRVARYDPQGNFVSEIKFAAAHTSCPAFGGEKLDQLFVTSATQNLDKPGEGDGKTFIASTVSCGQKEHQVK